MKKNLLSILLGFAIFAGSILAQQSSVEAASTPKGNLAETNKKIVESFWNGIFNQHDVSFIHTYVGTVYIQHSPSFKDGKDAFQSAISAYLIQFPYSSAEIKRIVSDKDYVFIHNNVKLNPNDPGQAAVDIFRVKDGKIIEHWDVLQDIPEKAENNNTMF
ncbi:nuclear transport factor 2 family protein [Pelosinus propionicus]|uniref:Predicted SnoaL-like aldol condensation-catalyzing enzyme n=1 Tax=Pelosinus propionicus DSM 13327 TaxID=1123291 RepID=A0A1I4I888_9FIRM|nr:ester cyclase [Pelosinus propionicus]SFL50602.1 Predicted SnoaL-like aldol condensation-catalyzing enzyme [Pelosinus propionicus DSM 13327]